ncbi:MAG TPA: hypothetical protein VG817_02215, partial [Gemmatimonadales bacterium]|nr:hypothetical protein [Gemmatimonadales bacterium]
PELRLPELAHHPLAALQAYLEGRRAYRHGQYADAIRYLRSALDRDSTFALAALYLVDASDWVANGDASWARDRAWALREGLAPADLAYLTALVGPHFPALPSTAERLNAWERAAALTPDRSESWYGLGDILYHRGSVLGAPQAGPRALEAFRRAASMDSAYAAPLIHLADIAFDAGETVEARRLALRYLALDSTSGIAGYFRWRLGIETASRPATSLSGLSSDGLFRVAVASQLSGVGVADGQRAAQELVNRAVTATELAATRRLRWLVAINMGRMDDLARFLGEVTNEEARPLRLAHLFGDGDPDWDTGSRDTTLFDRYIAILESLWRDGSSSETDLSALRRELRERPEAWTQAADIELTALVQCRGQSPAASHAIARLDSLIAASPLDSDWDAYRPLLLARCHEWRGDLPAALAALRRRPNEAWAGLPYLATFRREEGRVALQLKDTTSAIRAWTRYLNLRASADPVAVPERERIRAALAPLLARPSAPRGDRRILIPG